jgi:hypothetical protein
MFFSQHTEPTGILRTVSDAPAIQPHILARITLSVSEYHLPEYKDFALHFMIASSSGLLSKSVDTNEAGTLPFSYIRKVNAVSGSEGLRAYDLVFRVDKW